MLKIDIPAQEKTTHRHIEKGQQRSKSEGIFIGAVMPSMLIKILRSVKATAPKGKMYYTQNSKGNPTTITPKVCTIVIHGKQLVVIADTYHACAKGYTIDNMVGGVMETYPVSFTINLTDLVGGTVYPGVLNLIPDERLNLFKTDKYLVLCQGRNVFRLAVL